MNNLPAHYRLTYSQQDIAQRIGDLGQEVGLWAEEVHRETGKQLLAICILRGAAFFFCDLLRAIPETVELTYCRASSYSSDENVQLSSGVELTMDMVEPEGRAILLIDDICDTGSTMKSLSQEFLSRGATEVRSSVLIYRKTPKSIFTPTWSGFECQSDDWFVGFGMEDKNYFSNLPEVYTIERDTPA